MRNKASEITLTAAWATLWQEQYGHTRVESKSVKVKVTQSCPTLRPCGLYSPWNSPGQNPGVGSLSLL